MLHVDTPKDLPRLRLEDRVATGVLIPALGTGDPEEDQPLVQDGARVRVGPRIGGDRTAVPDDLTRVRIDGEVQAAHIVVNGTINGPVHATETLELQSGSRVKGDVYYKTIEIHQGAVVEGRLVHHANEMKGVELKLASST